MHNFLKIFFPVVFIFSFVNNNNIDAQEPLDFDEIKVIAPYEPSISDAFKINDMPVIEDTLDIERELEYNIQTVKLETSFELEPIEAARMRGEPISKLYRGHLKGGFGSHYTPYGELFYNSLRSNEYAYGLRLKHQSSAGKVENYPHSGYSDNLAEVYGKRFFRDHTLEGGIDYNRNVLHFYGIDKNREKYSDTDNFPEKDDIRQQYNYFSANTGFRNNNLDSLSLSYDFGINYNFLNADYALQDDNPLQHNISFSGTIQRQLPPDPMEFSENQHFKFDTYADYYNNQSPLDSSAAGIFGVNPRLYSSYKDFEFYLGFNAAFKFEKNNYFRIHPIAGSKANLIDDVLAAYAYLSGGIKRHNLYDFSRENPFINSELGDFRFKNTKSKIGGGFKGSIGSMVSYNLSASNSTIENYAFYVTDVIIDDDNNKVLDNKMTIVYDDLRLFNFRGEIFSQIADRINLRFASNYYQYSLDNEIKPWHKPTARFDLSVNYNIQDKIIFTAEAFARNSWYGRIFDEEGNVQKKEIHGFHVDTNFGVEYRYTNRLAVFLNFNNVQNQPLERWLNYPSQKFNFLGGAAFSF